LSILDAFRRRDGEEHEGLRIIVGLGNPGDEYQDTPHNMGFAVLSEMTARAGISFRRGPRRGMETARLPGAMPVLLMRPLSFMNRSGIAVSSLLRYYDRAPEDLLIVCDDVNLPLGQLRFRRSGGAGGQKGLASIIEQLRTQEFARLRIGVGGGHPGADVASHVLSRFRGDRLRTARDTVATASAAVDCWLAEGLDAAMNRYNRNETEQD